MFKFEQGVTVKDKITGFKGIITCRGDYITGCNQYGVMPPLKDGDMGKVVWFDEHRLELVDDGVSKSFDGGNRTTGGPYGGVPSK